MLRIVVLYYSRTWNTERMAKAIVEGAKEVQGVNIELKFDASPEELVGVDALIIGMPTYHHDMTMQMKGDAGGDLIEGN